MSTEQKHIELVLGGARSGKSSYAEQQATDSLREVIYVATSQVLDDEMALRVEHHKKQRPEHWQVVEEPLDLPQVLSQYSKEDNCILVDCLTLWVTNCMFSSQSRGWDVHKQELLDVLSELPGKVIFVSNEVGSGIVPMNEMSRRFVDESGWLHQAIAKQVDAVTLVVAGLPMRLKG